MPPAHFHHIQLNSTDPAAAINFYTAKFDCEKARFAGKTDAVWAQKSWLLFNKVGKPPQADVTITIVGMNGNMSFSPNPGTVPVGKTVAWTNATSSGYGGATHHITADNGSFSTGDIAPGSTSTPIKMSTAGSFAYHCTIHPTMVGSVTVQ